MTKLGFANDVWIKRSPKAAIGGIRASGWGCV